MTEDQQIEKLKELHGTISDMHRNLLVRSIMLRTALRALTAISQKNTGDLYSHELALDTLEKILQIEDQFK